MRATALLTLLVVSPLLAQQPPPRFLYLYRDSLKQGVDSAYGAIENEAAQVCADLQCPNPYLGLESLSGPHEAWWINAFATEADTARVARAYAQNGRLAERLGAVAQRKRPLIGTPIEGFAVHRPDLSRGPAWPVTGARFMVVSVGRVRRPGSEGSVWQMKDSTLYVFRPAQTRREARALAREPGARILVVRPEWSLPAPEWVAADRKFWRFAPRPKSRPSPIEKPPSRPARVNPDPSTE